MKQMTKKRKTDVPPENQSLAKQLIAFGRERGCNQVELAKEIHISPTTLRLLEHNEGNPRYSTLQKISSAWGKPVRYLFYGESEFSGSGPVPYFQRVSHYRKEKHITIEALANEAGISVSHLRSIEAGERDCTLGTLLKLCTALKITLKELIIE